VPLVALLGLSGIAVAYVTIGRAGRPTIPDVDDVVRLHINLSFPLESPHKPLPPAFDAPPERFAEILGDLNQADRIDPPKTKLTIGYVEVWYRNGAGLRVELFLIASNDAALTSKDLVLATTDGVWRRGRKFLDFAETARNAYRDAQATSDR
jgi:hypothetical protein